MRDYSEEGIKAFIRALGERAEAFGTTAVPVTATEFAYAADIGAIEYLTPIQGGGVVAEYKPYVGGRPLFVVGLSDHVRAA